MSSKVKTTMTDATVRAGLEASKCVSDSRAFGEVRASTVASGNSSVGKVGPSRKPGMLRSHPTLLTVPIVLVSTLAIGLNLAAPAQAQPLVKKPLKSKLAETTPLLAVGAITQSIQAVSTESAPPQYTVVTGDTVSGIAARFGLSTSAVLAANGLDSRAPIFPNQVLTLRQTDAPAATPTASVSSVANSYTVRSGDTISAIAAAHGLTTASVLAANGLNNRSVIHPDQVVLLAAPAAMAAAVWVAPVETLAASTTHTIESGDTITGVAKAAGVSVQAVLDANGLGWSSIIYPGQVLALPTTSAPASAAPASTASAPIATSGIVTPMSSEMLHNAQTIVSVGRGAGVSDAGLVIALAAAAQESGLRNVDYGDRDSLGLFQQRPSAGWGSPEQVMNPVRASLAFFGGASNPNPTVTRGLLDIAGWEAMTVTQAAQAVQISAYPDYYAKWQTSAEAWLSQIG